MAGVGCSSEGSSSELDVNAELDNTPNFDTNTNTRSERRWVVYSGRNGPGIYGSWFGPGGAHEQVNGFSDGCSERVSSQAEAERRLAAAVEHGTPSGHRSRLPRRDTTPPAADPNFGTNSDTNSDTNHPTHSGPDNISDFDTNHVSRSVKGYNHERVTLKRQNSREQRGKATGGHAALVNKWNDNLREEIVGTTCQRLCGESAVGKDARRRKTETESCINCRHPGKCQTVHNDTHRGGNSWPHSSKRKCPHDLLCREMLLHASPGVHNAQIQNLVEAVSSFRWAQDELSDDARNSHLGQAINTAYFSVLGVQVCLSTFCWAHGHTRHRAAKAGTGHPKSDRSASLSGRRCK